MEKTGILVTYNVPIDSNIDIKDRKYIAIRTDIDALPIQETTNLSFKSIYQNVSHSCGHDMHMGCVLTLAHYILDNETYIGNVKLIFQPAEEIDLGAKEMIKANVLDQVSQIYGFHVFTPFNYGVVGVTNGVIMGSTHTFKITIKGDGGHGAEPFKTKDPIMASSVILTKLYNIKNKITSYEPSSLSICSIHGGSTFNVCSR